MTARPTPGYPSVLADKSADAYEKVVDRLLTNFHLPESTLMMLVCAFGGYERLMRAYRHAVVQRYRFFSYGDAMLIDPH